MTSPDDELDDFLRKRRPLFGRADDLEPPLELDRMVLRQAREAIESERPQRIFRTPSWGMPVALAATLVLAFTIILRVGKPEVVKQPEVTVQTVSRQVAMPAPPPPAPAAAPAESAPAVVAQTQDSGAVFVDLGAARAKAEAETSRATASRARQTDQLANAAQPASAPALDAERGAASRAEPAAATAPAAASAPLYRRDARTWLAEIERLRAAGETQRADAELAEYKREHRAYAGAPDR